MELISPERLRRPMDRQAVSARAVARAAGWKSHTYMQRLLRGEEKNVKVASAVRIAYFLDVSIDDLFLTKTSSEAVELANLRAAKSRPQKTGKGSARRTIEGTAA